MGRVRDYLRCIFGADKGIVREYVDAGRCIVHAELDSTSRYDLRLERVENALAQWRAAEEKLLAAGYRPLSYEKFYEFRTSPDAARTLETLVRRRFLCGPATRHAEHYRPARIFTDDELREINARSTPVRRRDS